jgi:hypothetical protein
VFAFVKLLLTGLIISSCATATILPKGEGTIISNPNYEDSKSYFFWGLAGEHTIDVVEVCGDKEVSQMQSEITFGNGFVSAITLGIYSPKTAKVWCN